MKLKAANMREIKFRYYLNQGTKDHKVFSYERHKFFGECEAMQYTGLKDKNGIDIYEGDIVINNYFNYSGKFIGDIWEVKFGEGEINSQTHDSASFLGWYVENSKHEVRSFSPYSGDEYDVEVIGNIHENPDLLRSSK